MRLALPLIILFAGPSLKAAEPANDFFESKVRPVLIEHCHACHGEKKQEASLRLDSREAILKGGEHGPIVDLKVPENSRLIKAVHHDGQLKMPPKGKLPNEAIDALRTWVAMGVPFPAAPPKR